MSCRKPCVYIHCRPPLTWISLTWARRGSRLGSCSSCRISWRECSGSPAPPSAGTAADWWASTLARKVNIWVHWTLTDQRVYWAEKWILEYIRHWLIREYTGQKSEYLSTLDTDWSSSTLGRKVNIWVHWTLTDQRVHWAEKWTFKYIRHWRINKYTHQWVPVHWGRNKQCVSTLDIDWSASALKNNQAFVSTLGINKQCVSTLDTNWSVSTLGINKHVWTHWTLTDQRVH